MMTHPLLRLRRFLLIIFEIIAEAFGYYESVAGACFLVLVSPHHKNGAVITS
jgi:hypothetical protein